VGAIIVLEGFIEFEEIELRKYRRKGRSEGDAL